MANTTEEQICMIQGDADIIGPGIRLSTYLQFFLIIIKGLVIQENFMQTMEFGLVTSISLIISAILQYKIDGLHYIFLILVSQMANVLLAMSFINGGTISGDEFNVKKMSLLFLPVFLLNLCYNVWLWATIRWRLPQQMCGDKVRIFLIFFSLDPNGWMRDFFLYANSIILAMISMMTCCYAVIKKDFPDNPVKFLIAGKNPTSIFEYFLCMYIIPTIIITEMTVQKNPISGIWDWSFGQIVVMVVAAADVLNTIISLISLILKPDKRETVDVFQTKESEYKTRLLAFFSLTSK